MKFSNNNTVRLTPLNSYTIQHDGEDDAFSHISKDSNEENMDNNCADLSNGEPVAECNENPNRCDKKKDPNLSIENGTSPRRKKLKKVRRKKRNKVKIDDISDIDLSKDIQFTPERCIASPSWDAWSFGLIMVQLLIGRCVYLPNFEKAEDALLYNLSSYNLSKLKKIHDQLQEAVGRSAADLVSRLLNPEAEERLSSFDEIMRHPYFMESVLRAKSLSLHQSNPLRTLDSPCRRASC